VRLGRARGRALAGKAAEAAEAAAALTNHPATPGDLLYDGARVYSLATGGATDARQREAYAGQVLALLRRAAAAGFFKGRREVERLKKDADLGPLRPREEFKQLVAGLEAAAKQ
jgi:hypothetical protein